MKEIKAKTGVVQKPIGCVLYARSGLGKTTFLGDCIKSAHSGILFQCGEDSLSDLDPTWANDVPYYEEILGSGRSHDELADGWVEFMDLLKYLMTEDHGYTTIAFDNFDNLINNNLDAYVVREYYGNNLSKANNYGGAKLKEMYSELVTVIKGFEYLQSKKGISLFVSFHAQPTNFRDPANPDYKRWSLAVPAREDYNLRTVMINWSSATMFGTVDIEVDGKKATGNKRILRTVEDAAYEAKCRYKIADSIDFTFDAFKQSIASKG